MTDRDARAAGHGADKATATAGKVADDLQKTMGRAMREQAQRQERLRHVQEFLSAPTFLDLGSLGQAYTDPPEALEDRWRDLDYRVTVLRSILGMMEEEREMLARLLKGDGSDSADPSGPDPATPELDDAALDEEISAQP